MKVLALSVFTWFLVGPVGAQVKPPIRTFYKDAGYRPAAMKVELNAGDAETIYNALGNERVVLSVDETRNGKPGKRLLFGAELLPRDVTGLADPTPDQKLFVADNDTGRPSIVIQANHDPVKGRYSTTIWFWIWDDVPAGNHKATHQFKLIKSPSSGKDVVRFELNSPSEAFSLYDRLQIPVEQGENANFNPPIPANVKPFISSDGSAFTFACYEYREGQELKSVHCAFETTTAGATIVAANGKQEPLVAKTYRSHTNLVYQHQQMKSKVLAYVRTQIQQRKLAKQQADEELMNRAIGAYIRSRPINTTNPSAQLGNGIQVLEALGPDNLRVLIDDARKVLGP